MAVVGAAAGVGAGPTMAAAHSLQVLSAASHLGRSRLAPGPTMATAILPTDMATATRILGTAITRPPTPIQGTATATIRLPTRTRPPTPTRATTEPLTTGPRMAWVMGVPIGLRASGSRNTPASTGAARKLQERQADHRLPALLGPLA